MAPIKLLNFITLSTLAILSCTFGPSTANASVITSDGQILARHVAHGHAALARKKRSTNAKRCKPRSSALPAPTADAPKSTPKAGGNSGSKNNGGNNGGNGGGGNNNPSPPPPSGNTGPGKMGLAWPNGNDPALKNFKSDKVKFLYTWDPHCPDLARQLGFECMPMLWGDRQIADFKNIVKPGYARFAMGMNEPNQRGQSDMSPQHGADLWRQYIDPLKHSGYYLISPATTSAPSGKQWMKDFFSACNGCQVDGVALHYYDVNIAAFQAYVKDFHNTFGREIWVTEYACQNFNGGAQCDPGHTWDFHHQMMNFFESTSWVRGYFPFGAMHDMQGVNPDNQLLAGNGQPTGLGGMYIH